MPNEAKDKEVIWLSPNQAGKLLGVSGKTVVRMMEAGDLAGYQIGSVWKFKKSDIENYIESRRFRGKKDKKGLDENGMQPLVCGTKVA